MNEKFVEIMQCPHSKEDLYLEINEKAENGCVISGYLHTKDKKYTYPIIRGIPRFVNEEMYSQSFGFEWNQWPKVQFESENIGKPMEGHTAKMFNLITGFSGELIEGSIVGDFGCGPGRFLDLVRKMGGVAVGIDLSLAVEAARKNFLNDPNVLIIQGDILNPPIKNNILNYAYSIGVLHHTPDPHLGFNCMAQTVKSGGRVAVSVYSNNGFYHYPSVLLYRNIYKMLSKTFGREKAIDLAKKYSNFSAKRIFPAHKFLREKIPFGKVITAVLERTLIVNLYIPDENWRILDTFDAITPYYASTHSEEEIFSWFSSLEFNNIKQMDWGKTSFVGVK